MKVVNPTHAHVCLAAKKMKTADGNISRITAHELKQW